MQQIPSPTYKTKRSENVSQLLSTIGDSVCSVFSHAKLLKQKVKHHINTILEEKEGKYGAEIYLKN